MKESPTRIFITGASTGIGKALALSYAHDGVSLGLLARRKKLLRSVADQCEQRGAKSIIYPLDVQDQKAMAEAADDFITRFQEIDLVIANAGIGGHDDIIHGDATTINRIIDINLKGVINTLVPFIPVMKKQSGGTLVLISSVMAFLPMPFHGGYSAAKTALVRLADSWRPTLKKYHIQVTAICPGFVETPMIEKQSNKVFVVPAGMAALKIKRAIQKGRKTFIFPWQVKILIPLLRKIPSNLFKELDRKNK